jgi:hypothetical protein
MAWILAEIKVSRYQFKGARSGLNWMTTWHNFNQGERQDD